MNSWIFLDASFWIALRTPQESRCDLAHAILAKLRDSRPKFVTSLLVAAETHAFVSRTPRLRNLVLNDIEANPIFRLEPVTPADESGAIQLLRQQKDKSYSLCDAVSFVMMERLGVSRVLTFDDHFGQVGRFEVLDHPDSI